MSYQVKFGSNIMEDTFYTLIPVNVVLKVFVLSNVRRQQTELVQYWSWIITILVTMAMVTLNILRLTVKFLKFETNQYVEIKFIDSVQLTYLLGFAEYIIDLLLVYKMRHRCVKYLQFYADIDNILGDPNFSAMRLKNVATLLSFIISYAITSLFDFVSWAIVFNWITPVYYVLDYIYAFINGLTILDVLSNLIQIEYRIVIVLKTIEEYYDSNLTRIDDMNRDDIEVAVQPNLDKIRVVPISKGCDVLSVSKCYVMLMEQVNFINTAYGIRLVVFCFNIMIYLIYFTNTIIRLILGQLMIPSPICYLPATSAVFRMANFAALLVALVYRSQKTYTLCADIVRVIDLAVVTKKIPAEINKNLLELRALMLSRPVQFHGANFFTLDHRLLVSVASIVVTYSIILLQSMR